MTGQPEKPLGDRDATIVIICPALFGVGKLRQHRLGRVVWLGGDGAQGYAGNGVYCVYAAVFAVWDLP